MGKICLLTVLILYSFSCSAQVNNNTIKEKVAKERLKLKNYAFCECLKQVYKGDSLFIKDGSSAGYFQTGAYSINTYEAIDSIAKIFSIKEYKSKENHPLGIMKCLDFYNSKELDELIISLDKEIDKERFNE